MKRAWLLLAALPLAGCGLKEPLRPPPGETLPPAPQMASRPLTPEEMLTPPPIARPERVDVTVGQQDRGDDLAADACRRHPDRFSACAAFDPRDVKGSVKEIERAMGSLGLNGAVLNSHFQGHYIDELEYFPILEALEAMDAALYIHPTAPFNAPHYETRGFFGALAGFPHDVWLHTMGLIFSGDQFYSTRPELTAPMVEHGVLAVEMEAAALYTLAAYHRRRALAICTVSDHIVTGEETTSREREQTFGPMVEIALEAALGA